MVQKFFIAAVIIFLSVSCNSTKQTVNGPGQLTNEEKNNGWKLLFDGKTTNGWHRYGRGAIDSVWKVKDGILCLDTMAKKEFNIKGDWDIVTDDEYENFDLQLEWKISKDGNSGIIFYINEDKKVHKWPWETGMEMKVIGNNVNRDAQVKKNIADD